MELGDSTHGEPILGLKVGNGSNNALIHGFPNSEEPYGGNLLTYLTRALAENPGVTERLDYTWYLVPCSDPDAARRNEGFQSGDKSVLSFCLNYYRTPVSHTPELCFPYRFGPLDLDHPVPETRALMKVMDEVKLHFVSGLHMMKWGGISYMVPFECPELYADLQNAAERFDVFLRKRPGSMLAPGVMWAEYLTAARNYVRHYAAGERNIEPLRGCQMWEYGQQYNPQLFIMIPECCKWYDPRMLDDRPSDTSIGEAFEYGDGKMREMEELVLALWKRAEPELKHDSVFRGMMEENVAPLIHRYTNVSNPPFRFSDDFMRKKATVAQKIGIEGHDDLYRMFYLGALVRTPRCRAREERKRPHQGAPGRGLRQAGRVGHVPARPLRSHPPSHTKPRGHEHRRPALERRVRQDAPTVDDPAATGPLRADAVAFSFVSEEPAR